VVNPSTDKKWLLYRDLTTQSMRTARPYWVDNVPPAASAYLNPSGGCDSIYVDWQATGDNGMTGFATAYDLRWSGNPITTDAAFKGAVGVPVALPTPHAPGTAEHIGIYTGNCGPHKYFGLKIRDDVGNLSPLTPDPYGAQTACVHPPLMCWDAKTGPAKEMPARTEIVSLHPNPTSGAIDVDLALAPADKGAPLNLSVFNVAGRRVATLRKDNPGPGQHLVRWDLRDDSGRAVATGIYFIRLRVASQNKTQRFVVVR